MYFAGHLPIPCVGFALEEKAHLNVSKSRLDELGLPTDPSLNERQRLARAAAVKHWLPVHFSSRHTAKRDEHLPDWQQRREQLNVTPLVSANGLGGSA